MIKELSKSTIYSEEEIVEFKDDLRINNQDKLLKIITMSSEGDFELSVVKKVVKEFH